MTDRSTGGFAVALAAALFFAPLATQADDGATSIEVAGVGRVVVDPPPDPLAELESVEQIERRGRRMVVAGGTLIPFGALIPAIATPVAASERWCDYPGESCEGKLVIQTAYTGIVSGFVGFAMIGAGIGLVVRGRRMRNAARDQKVELQIGAGTLLVRGHF